MSMGFDISCKKVARSMKIAADTLIEQLYANNKEEKLYLIDNWLEDCDEAINHLRRCDSYPSNWGDHGQPYEPQEIENFISKMEEGFDILTQSLMKTLE